MPDDDAVLVEGCLAGDTASMRTFVERFQGIVFGVSYRMLGRREDAEDVSQEVFLRAFRSLARWDSNRPLRPWLLTIATNRCRTFLQKRARQPLASDLATQLAADSNSAGADDLAEELQLALSRLRPEYQTCFLLFHQQDLSCAEIGEIMDSPDGTIKTWLHRARRELAVHLQRRGVVPDGHYEQFRI